MSYAEFLRWIEYRKLRGGFHIGLRTDRAIGLLAMLYTQANSDRKVKLSDFLPYESEKEEEKVISTPEEFMQIW